MVPAHYKEIEIFEDRDFLWCGNPPDCCQEISLEPNSCHLIKTDPEKCETSNKSENNSI